MNNSKKCKNCGQRIVLVNFISGESWQHQPTTSSFSDDMTTYCATTIAEPEEV